MCRRFLADLPRGTFSNPYRTAVLIYEKLKSRIALNSVLETEILRSTVFVSSVTYRDDDDQI